jgi:hypothetical protein
MSPISCPPSLLLPCQERKEEEKEKKTWTPPAGQDRLFTWLLRPVYTLFHLTILYPVSLLFFSSSSFFKIKKKDHPRSRRRAVRVKRDQPRNVLGEREEEGERERDARVGNQYHTGTCTYSTLVELL